jgi:hypothetical protein
MKRNRICLFCGDDFRPSLYHPEQKVCGATECQKKRRAAYHKRKLLEDPTYFEQCRESRKHWRQNNKARLAEYRKKHKNKAPLASDREADAHKKRLLASLKTTSVLDLRECRAELWASSSDVDRLQKIFASANIIILQLEQSCSPPL